MQYKLQNKNASTNMPNLGLEVNDRNKGETKLPSCRRCDRMLHTIHCRQNTNCQEATNISQPSLPYNEPNLCNDYIFKALGYNDRFCINFPCHCVLGHVLSDTNPLDNVGSTGENIGLIRLFVNSDLPVRTGTIQN